MDFLSWAWNKRNMAKKLTTATLLVATAEEASNLRYACGFTAPDAVVFLKHGSARHLVVPPLELGRAQQLGGQTRIWTPADLDVSDHERRTLSGWTLGLLRKLKLDAVQVSRTFPLHMARALESEGIRVDVCDTSLFPKRVIKSEQEIDNIREAQRAAVAAMRKAQQCIQQANVDRQGKLIWKNKTLTSERVRFEIDVTLLHRNCIAQETIVAGGRQGADPHERGSGPLYAGQPIVLDIFPQHRGHGYWGDITRTVINGTPHPEVLRMYHAVKKAQREALAMVRPGARADRIHQHVDQVLKEAGFETSVSNGVAQGFFHSTGHGVGLDIHEAPRISSSRQTLKKGHVITIEPGLYYPSLGGIRIEDTVAVTADGFEMLAGMKKAFQLA